MSRVAELSVQLRETAAAIKRTDDALAGDPLDEALQFNLESLEKRQARLQSQFYEATSQQLLDVCEYRFIPDIEERYPAAGIGSAISAFQELVAIAFDAIKNGPKRRARVAAEIVQQVELDLHYAAAGSLQLVFSVPNERLIGIQSALDQAISSVNKALVVSQPSELTAISHEIGLAGIRKVYGWARAHSDFGFSTEIKWKRGAETRESVLVQVPQLERLRTLIEETKEVTTEMLSLVGMLVGLDVELGTFHLAFPDADAIRGELAKTFERVGTWTIPGRYSCRIRKTLTVFYSSDFEETKYEILEASKL